MPKDMGLPFGPYPLTAEGIKVNVMVTSPGAYALGKRGNDGVFYIGYVGRADDGVAKRLRDHEGGISPRFHVTFCGSAEAAYVKECQLHHDSSPLV